MIKGFKDFLLRGNVVDLAVAVVIGAAFGAVVTSFTEKIIQPIINSFGGTGNSGLGFEILKGNAATRVDFSALISALINFLIVAAVIYFVVVVPMKAIMERTKRGEVAADEAPAPDVALLTEIRDLLRSRNV